MRVRELQKKSTPSAWRSQLIWESKRSTGSSNSMIRTAKLSREIEPRSRNSPSHCSVTRRRRWMSGTPPTADQFARAVAGRTSFDQSNISVFVAVGISSEDFYRRPARRANEGSTGSEKGGRSLKWHQEAAGESLTASKKVFSILLLGRKELMEEQLMKHRFSKTN